MGRVGVDAEESGDLGEDAGLFQALAHGALRGTLADVLRPTGQCPLSGVAAALEQDGSVAVDDQQVAGRDEAVGLGGAGVVEVLGPAQTGCSYR